MSDENLNATDGAPTSVTLEKMETKFTTQKYVCSRHGETDANMTVRVYNQRTVDGSDDWQTPRPVAMERNYCCYCYVEALDRLGVEDMTPVK